MTGLRSSAGALGAIGMLVGVVLVLGGMGPMGEYRDSDGFYMSNRLAVDRPSHAIVSNDVDLLRGRWDTLMEDSLLPVFVDEPDDVRMQAAGSGSTELSLGIAPTSAVNGYLSGVAHDEITHWNADRANLNEVEYTTHQGTARSGPPGTEGFWVISVVGTGTQTLDWTIESGDWTAVVMNADASPGITTELAFGAAPTSDIQTIAGTAMTIGAVALLGGGLLLYLGMSGRDR